MIIQRKRGLQAVLVLTQGILITLVFVLCAVAAFSFFTSADWFQLVHYPFYVFAITAGLFLGLAVLTKGPVAILVALLSFIVYIIVNKGLWGYRIWQLVLIAVAAFLTTCICGMSVINASLKIICCFYKVLSFVLVCYLFS